MPREITGIGSHLARIRDHIFPRRRQDQPAPVLELPIEAEEVEDGPQSPYNSFEARKEMHLVIDRNSYKFLILRCLVPGDRYAGPKWERTTKERLGVIVLCHNVAILVVKGADDEIQYFLPAEIRRGVYDLRISEVKHITEVTRFLAQFPSVRILNVKSPGLFHLMDLLCVMKKCESLKVTGDSVQVSKFEFARIIELQKADSRRFEDLHVINATIKFDFYELLGFIIDLSRIEHNQNEELDDPTTVYGLSTWLDVNDYNPIKISFDRVALNMQLQLSQQLDQMVLEHTLDARLLYRNSRAGVDKYTFLSDKTLFVIVIDSNL
ncbi:unnamed protein product [Caenorhabditis auriculariae]|uniref:Uncharacterized protein n=1 Tax=Caenorhabditis auriculariae TaxID=2777116 RepID=A0A8S1HH35_9PELO|nr:unnamed protein product [Caenorhabditis auriculariae]